MKMSWYDIVSEHKQMDVDTFQKHFRSMPLAAQARVEAMVMREQQGGLQKKHIKNHAKSGTVDRVTIGDVYAQYLRDREAV